MEENNNKMGLSLESVLGGEMMDVPLKNRKCSIRVKQNLLYVAVEVTSSIIKMNDSLSLSVLIRAGMRESGGDWR
jgi:hypothetical protein